MRVGLVRTDLNKIYLADLENRSQRCFSSEPPGQSRYLSYPTTSALQPVLNAYGLITKAGTNAQGAGYVTNAANDNDINIRVSPLSPYTTISVTSGAAVTATTIVNDLNTGFNSAGLPLLARRVVVGLNIFVFIDTTVGGTGVVLDVQATVTATLPAILGIPTGSVSSVTVSTLISSIYQPPPQLLNVSSTNISLIGTWGNLTLTALNTLTDAIADVVAPSVVETGPALLSFVYGNLSKYNSPSFQPGGARVGLPAGAAVAVLEDDGVTPFTV